MTKKQESILESYANKKAVIANLQEELDELEPQVLSFLEKEGVDTLREDYGTFSVVYRKKWTYSSELTEKEKQYAAIVKQAKADEQESGEAKAEEVKGLSYRKYEPNQKEKA